MMIAVENCCSVRLIRSKRNDIRLCQLLCHKLFYECNLNMIHKRVRTDILGMVKNTFLYW